jgi:hypothetical protein
MWVLLPTLAHLTPHLSQLTEAMRSRKLGDKPEYDADAVSPTGKKQKSEGKWVGCTMMVIDVQ